MKQIVFHAFGPPSIVARCEEAGEPSSPSAWEVTVQVEAFPINPADSAMIRGQYGFLNQPPSGIGMEGAGRIIEVGKSVKDLRVGDPVILLANNNWCQRRTVPATLVVKVPEDADLNQMAMLKVTGLTAWKLLTEIIPLKSGDTIVQNAPLSAVGQCVIQIANILGI
ncbi:MAG: alcohol dehydrogenase catalytic domain-containing protein, partial [Planctomycetales bacterium]|nr:alcohol dehydrogenase catalytic domain-containing protein [Planctomycetales bacterium]